MFDPYRKWLGIPEGQRPPTHYQLLGLSRTESDPEVIASAAIRQTAYVRNFQAGPHAVDCARVLGELARARAVLSDPSLRAQYEASLSSSETVAIPPVLPTLPSVVVERPGPIKEVSRQRSRGTPYRFAAYLTAVAVASAFGLHQASKTPSTPAVVQTVAQPSSKPALEPLPIPFPASPSPGSRESKPSGGEVAMVDPPERRIAPQSSKLVARPQEKKPEVMEVETPAAPDVEAVAEGESDADPKSSKASPTDPPPGGGDEASRAEALLNQKGLVYEKGRFVFPEEDDVLARFPVVKAAGDALKMAQGVCNEINAVDWNLQATEMQIPALRADIRNLQIEMRSMPARRNAEQAAYFEQGRQNLVMGNEQLNQLMATANMLRGQQASPEARRLAWEAYEKARGELLAKLAEIRPFIEPVAEKYRQAREDPEIKAAFYKVRPESKVPVKLGPSQRFLDMVKYVNGAKASTDLTKRKAAAKSGKVAKK